VFLDFSEVPIKFPPSYKYSEKRKLLETDELEPHKEPDYWPWSAHRFPSWCDRILFLPSDDLETHVYDVLPILATSDHRAVALSTTISTRSGKTGEERTPPFPIEPLFAVDRTAARMRELVVGVLSYLSLTSEGNTLLVALLAGSAAGWYLLQSLL
jgi:hypothetical protein